jgi:CheY-like chemotaxis protein
MNNLSHFLIVDDDEINNMICRLVIDQAVPNATIQTYTRAEKALHYISDEYGKENIEKQFILLLDINMPSMSGWEFLDRFDDLPERVKQSFQIFMLSSSVDERDMQRADANKNVRGFLSKPLNKQMVEKLSG